MQLLLFTAFPVGGAGPHLLATPMTYLSCISCLKKMQTSQIKMIQYAACKLIPIFTHSEYLLKSFPQSTQLPGHGSTYGNTIRCIDVYFAIYIQAEVLGLVPLSLIQLFGEREGQLYKAVYIQAPSEVPGLVQLSHIRPGEREEQHYKAIARKSS